MTSRARLWLGAALALAGVCTRASLRPLPASLAGLPKAESAVVLVLDAAAAGHFGCYGYPRQTTPNIDRIAQDAIVFETAYSPAAYTQAAMSAAWASREPGSRGWRSVPRLAELLSARGLHTAGFVGNGNAGELYDLDRGFREFHELYETASRAEGFVPALAGFLGGRPPGRFFAYLHLREPHFPYDPPAPYAARFGTSRLLPPEAGRDPEWIDSLNRRPGGATPAELEDLTRLYDANLAYADAVVARLVLSLRTRGLLERTALVITADHGEALGEHGFVGHNAQVYAESVRIPLIVRPPGGTGRGQIRLNALASLIDLAPTIVGLLGFGSDAKARESFHGRDLLAAREGSEARAVLSRSAGPHFVYALRGPRHTLILDRRSGRTELYDRKLDPHEARDLARREPVLTAELARQLHARLAAQGAAPELAAVPLSPAQQENLRSLGYLR